MDNIYNATTQTISDVSKVIEQLTDIGERVPSDCITGAIRELNHYTRELNENLNKLSIDHVIVTLTELAKEHDFGFKYENNANSTCVLTINNVYAYSYQRLSQMDQLIDFIKYVLKDIPAVQVANFFKEPVVELSLETDEPKTAIEETINEEHDTITHPLTQHWTVTTATPEVKLVARNDTSTIKEMPRFSAEQIDEQRQASVDHLRSVKNNITDGVELAKKEKLKHRIGEMADGIGGTSLDVAAIREQVDMWLNNMSNDKTMTLFELVDLIKTKARVDDPMLIRLVIQICIVNYRQKLQDTPAFIESDKSKNMYMQMSSIDKELLVGISVVQLDMIQQQSFGRPYGNYQLAIYLIDLCNKSSSLVVTESPEEIVSLTIGVYNILLSKNLAGDFVYAADVNNQYDVYPEDWFKKNNVISNYLNRIQNITEGDGQHDIIGIISNLIAKRDVTMSTPRLPTDDVNSVFEWASKLPNKETNEFLVRLGHNDDVYVIYGEYPVGVENETLVFKQTVIVATGDTMVAFVKPKNGGLTQEFYNPEHVGKLALWLNFFLPVNNGEF